MAAALLKHGCRVSVLCPARHPLTYVAGIERFYRYGRAFSLSQLRKALLDLQPNVVVPCDDGVVAQLHALHREQPSLRPLIERSLGSPQGFSLLDSRFSLIEAAFESGIRVPKTVTIEKENDLVKWHAAGRTRTVLKVDGECGGNGVRITRSLAESKEAREQFRTSRSASIAFKRAMIDLDPIAVWQHGRRKQLGITAQEFIEGRPANSMLVCWRGELLAMISVIVVSAEGATGAATIVRRVRNDEMRMAAKLLALRFGLTGFYGLDFMIESATGRPYLIEMNPRCTQLGHIEFADQGSLAGIYAAALRGEQRPVARNPVSQETIALFPQALGAGEACAPYIRASYHDVPLEEPQLRHELMLGAWPFRRLMGRLYQALRPMRRAEPMIFEELPQVSAGQKIDAAAP
jgi:hypothetical protein